MSMRYEGGRCTAAVWKVEEVEVVRECAVGTKYSGYYLNEGTVRNGKQCEMKKKLEVSNQKMSL